MIHKGPLNDIAVFKYTPPNHVFKVNQTGFQYCIKPPVKLALTTGNDVITLVTLGEKWYICGFGEHCTLFQQKLAINVLVKPMLLLLLQWPWLQPLPPT
ncbi:hypothetical protein CRG98_038748 [Punica granatum]|uniref:Phytocyanin domain-containing protein n=1 Tax=Punica granatum TaxID=22663 RepID=A0A2I0IA47_PUNGR|nr:hypothetical protein CRG98_038748 [Punica granatum]